jgi:ArsR family transcriptional regulator, virulence genes transcriptional regulator
MDLVKMQESAQRASEMMKLLGHPHRLMILCELKVEERSVGDLSTTIGISQSLVSQHLARMRHENVVTSRRDAQVVYYSLREGEAAMLISTLYDIFCLDGGDDD